MHHSLKKEIEKIFKSESGRVLASLIRILGDLDLAEEALQDAFSVALEKWPAEGLPRTPYAWLVSVGKFKAIDTIRRSVRGKELITENFLFETIEHTLGFDEDQYVEKYLIEDDQLRLIFYCCHPMLPLDSRTTLALREICGLSTKEISRAYLTSYENTKRRISRAKTLIKEQNIPYEIPTKKELGQRLDSVMQVIYLIYNEGYSATTGENHFRRELSTQAIYLGRKLVELLPSSESFGLLALFLIQESRKYARVSAEGTILSLDEQDRSLWDQKLIAEGLQLIHQAVMSGRLGNYSLQAAIASVYAVSDSVENTQWELIIGYYDMLLSVNNSPVIELNRAIAVGMHEGPKAAIKLIKRLEKNPKLSSYHILYSTLAEFSKRQGLNDEAVEAYQKAIEFASEELEINYLKQQLKKNLK
ncbi:RNA polymerase sigma factor [Kiloniella antarctica]|uniref:RNA polymerase sigma factor n=1 Tax=Kiloniella antarctica TaxID=1550907 RepID=A0ABW5BGF0_9PROT